MVEQPSSPSRAVAAQPRETPCTLTPVSSATVASLEPLSSTRRTINKRLCG
jgi:hypothetical protein